LRFQPGLQILDLLLRFETRLHRLKAKFRIFELYSPVKIMGGMGKMSESKRNAIVNA